MTEANLRPSSYQSHNMYYLHKSGEVCTQFQEKTAIHFATLGAIYSSTRHVHNLMKSQLYTYLSSEVVSARTRPSKNREGGSGILAGVEVYTAEC